VESVKPQLKMQNYVDSSGGFLFLTAKMVFFGARKGRKCAKEAQNDQKSAFRLGIFVLSSTEKGCGFFDIAIFCG